MNKFDLATTLLTAMVLETLPPCDYTDMWAMVADKIREDIQEIRDKFQGKEF